jgi:hypothetical protein
MNPSPVHRLPAPLEAAVQRIKLAAREAAERTIESLGLAALASTNAFHRDGLLGAQFELNRKSAMFALAFNDAFHERVMREVNPRPPGAAAGGAGGMGSSSGAGTLGLPTANPVPGAPSDWAALSLVEDKEVEAQISADRFGLEIAHACEWELRELDGYIASLLGHRAGGAERVGERERNPLRPELVGAAMIRGIEATSERPEIRKVLSTEFSRSLGALLPATYAAIVADMRNAGVQPLGLAARSRVVRGSAGGPAAPGGGDTTGASELHPMGGHGAAAHASRSGYATGRGVDPGRYAGPGSVAGGFAPSAHGRAGSIGHVDPALMNLIRRLAHTGAGGMAIGADAGWSDFGAAPGAAAPLPANVIRAHRDELRQASRGTLDHLVIDVIGFLFDQILADGKVPPQMARQIARLQLPVLRAALGDPTFFSSRRHPVRRFVNRIASLGAAFEDFGEDGAREFLAKVKALVGEIVEGDFEQIALYEQKLAALEQFAADVAAREVRGPGGDAAALLAEKEDQQRLRALYAQRLSSELKDLDAPPFLREFIAKVWSQVLLRAAEQGGADGVLAQRLRQTGRELYLSVQPKATPAHRKQFLAELPRLMQELTEGMNLIRWPEDQRRAFFGQLMPAHAEALKSAPARPLDINLNARKVEGALQRPLPSRDEVRAIPPAALPVLTDEVVTAFTPAEAERVGLVSEAAVDWNGRVDIDLGAQADGDAELTPEADAALPVLPGLPLAAEAAEPREPTEGRELAEHVQVGFAYRMHIDGAWHKVKLSHVSAARTFFIFTHGARHKKTVSLTQRMLVKLCETGRLKAYESAFLIERATARARRQLAALGGGAAAVATRS